MGDPDTLLPRRNSLNLVRLVLASLVVVSHVWRVAGYGEVHLGGYDVGRLSVAGFFAVSGYLVAKSKRRTGAGRYLWHRALRILPALFVVTLLTALVLGPLSLAISGRSAADYSWASAITYPLRNLTLVWPQTGIEGTIPDRSLNGEWNIPLWTLVYEALCYLGLLVLAAIGAFRFRWMIPALTLLLIVTNVAGIGLPGYTHHIGVADIGRLSTFAIPFGCGVSLALYDHAIPRWRVLGPMSAALALLVVFTAGESIALVSPSLAYALLWVARTVPLPALLASDDISYGVYIWGYPVQQILMTAGVGLHGPWVLFATTAVPTAVLALASYRLVEQPALRLKGWTPRRDRAKVPVG